jgi:hypothetical protein
MRHGLLLMAVETESLNFLASPPDLPRNLSVLFFGLLYFPPATTWVSISLCRKWMVGSVHHQFLCSNPIFRLV